MEQDTNIPKLKATLADVQVTSKDSCYVHFLHSSIPSPLGNPYRPCREVLESHVSGNQNCIDACARFYSFITMNPLWYNLPKY